jgi:hypothetical protein
MGHHTERGHAETAPFAKEEEPQHTRNEETQLKKKGFDHIQAMEQRDLALASVDDAGTVAELTEVQQVKVEDESSTSSCLCLGRRNTVRVLANKITESAAFTKTVMIVIILNCVLMTTADYRPECLTANYELKSNDHCWRNRVLDASEPIFTTFYVLELVLKVIGSGLVTLPTLCDFSRKGWHRAWKESKKSGYLNEYWNVVDFVVVVSGIVELVGIGNVNLSFLRAVRALRPLRTMKSIQSMRQLVEMLLNSVLSVSHTLVFLGFVFIIWAILSVQMWGWNGRSHGRCRLTPYPVALSSRNSSSSEYQTFRWPIDDTALAMAFEAEGEEARRCVDWATSDPWSTPQPCAWPMAPDLNGIVRLCGLPLSELVEGSMSAPRARVCPGGQWCGSNYDRSGSPRFADKKVMAADLFTADTNWGFNRYDHIFVAALSIFQALSMGGWRRPVWFLQDCFDPTGAALYFTSLMVIGTYFLIKLVLAVMVSSYNHADEEQLEEDQRQQAETVFRAVEKMVHGGGSSRGYVTMQEVRLVVKEGRAAQHLKSLHMAEELAKNELASVHLRQRSSRRSEGSRGGVARAVVGGARAVVGGGGVDEGVELVESDKARKRKNGLVGPAGALPKGVLQRLTRVQRAGERIEGSYPVSEDKFMKLMFDPTMLAIAASEKEAAEEAALAKEAGRAGADAGAGEEEGGGDDVETGIGSAVDYDVSAHTKPQKCWHKPLLPCLRLVVHHWLFDRTMLALILTNTAVMCADRYGAECMVHSVWCIVSRSCAAPHPSPTHPLTHSPTHPPTHSLPLSHLPHPQVPSDCGRAGHVGICRAPLHHRLLDRAHRQGPWPGHSGLRPGQLQLARRIPGGVVVGGVWIRGCLWSVGAERCIHGDAHTAATADLQDAE